MESKQVCEDLQALSRKEKLEIWKEMKATKSKQQQPSSSTTNLISSKQLVYKQQQAPQQKNSNKENFKTSLNSGNNKRLSGLSNSTSSSNPSHSAILSSKSLQSPNIQSPTTSTVPIDDFNNLKSKYRNLQKLHKSKLERFESLEEELSRLNGEIGGKNDSLKSVKSSFDAAQKLIKAQEQQMDEMKIKLQQLEESVQEKDDLIDRFARDYAPRKDLNEAKDLIAKLEFEESESIEIIQALKLELEKYSELNNQTEPPAKSENEVTKRLQAANMSLLAQLEQSKFDLTSKDKEMDKLKDVIMEILLENSSLHELVERLEQLTPAQDLTTSASRTEDGSDTITPQIRETVDSECQTIGDFVKRMNEAVFIAREFQNMKIANELMYQQLTEIQENSTCKIRELKHQVKRLERERSDLLDINQKLLLYQQERELTIEKLKRENEELRKTGSNTTSTSAIDTEAIYTEAFNQAEQMAMIQLREIMEKLSETENALDQERQKSHELEQAVRILMESDTTK